MGGVCIWFGLEIWDKGSGSELEPGVRVFGIGYPEKDVLFLCMRVKAF